MRIRSIWGQVDKAEGKEEEKNPFDVLTKKSLCTGINRIRSGVRDFGIRGTKQKEISMLKKKNK